VGFGLAIRFIDHLLIVSTTIYRAIINSHTLQSTGAYIMSSQSALSSLAVA
jgi:hypothetical protein